MRTFNSILALIFRLYGFDIGGLVVGIILAVLGFFFIAYCLAGIGNVQGSRRILGISAVSAILLAISYWRCRITRITHNKRCTEPLALRCLPARIGPYPYRNHIPLVLHEVTTWISCNLVWYVDTHIWCLVDNYLGSGADELCLRRKHSMT